MAANPSTSAAKKVKKPTRARRKKAAPASRGLSAIDVTEQLPAEGRALAEMIRADGGAPLAVYREPLGGHAVVMASLPIEKVEPTPYQRDLSEPHLKRLANAMERVDRYLDPLIAVRQEGKYWTPNGNHRLGAARLLGAKAVIALVLPEAYISYHIHAPNTEKAHNLKERSLEVIRMSRRLDGARSEQQTDFSALFEEPAFITLGASYEKRPRYSGGAYHPLVKRMETFFDLPLEEALRIREKRADKLLELDDKVVEIVNQMKAKGLVSPYLKNFVVARLNFLRFKKEPTVEFDSTLAKMLEMARKFNIENVKREDVVRMGGGAMEPEADE